MKLSTGGSVPPTYSPSPVRKRGITKLQRDILIGVFVGVIVLIVFVSLFASSAVLETKKNFSPYYAPVSQSSSSPSSMYVTDVDGGVTLVPWSGSNVLINGTVTARGFSASPDAVTFVESNSSGSIVFTAVFPSNTMFVLFPSYTVDVNVYVPMSSSFGTVEVTDTNGNVKVSSLTASLLTLTTSNGNVQASAVSATSLTLTTGNGSVDFSCSSCAGATFKTSNGNVNGSFSSLSPGGSYSLTTTNGNVGVTFPAASSCKLTANTTNGSISTSGLAGVSANAGTSLSTTLLTGSASVTLKTVNGSITITGN